MSFLDESNLHVKICGITNPMDALMCSSVGADALGFNFFPGSTRYISCDQAIPWIRDLGPFPARVAVVVNPEPSLLEQLRAAECFEWIQFHGDEPQNFCSDAGFQHWIKAIRVSDAGMLKGTREFQAPGLLLDAWTSGAYGGTGKPLNWKIAHEFVAANPAQKILLAGGLSIQNVSQAVQIVRPQAVDVASGVELTPRKKEEALVREFVRLAKNA